MRTAALTLTILFWVTAGFASDIREFDVKTVERLGCELARVSQLPDKGATNSVRKRAKQTAIAALKDRLFKIRYDYVVLDDPDGRGFLVYALAVSRDKIVMAGHFRVTVSADGTKAEKVDGFQILCCSLQLHRKAPRAKSRLLCQCLRP